MWESIVGWCRYRHDLHESKGQTSGLNGTWDNLLYGESMFTWVYLFIPCFDFWLTCGQHGLHYTTYEGFGLLNGWALFLVTKDDADSEKNSKVAFWIIRRILHFYSVLWIACPTWTFHWCEVVVLVFFTFLGTNGKFFHFRRWFSIFSLWKNDQKDDDKGL